jgi:hypothetical protein
LRGEDKGAKGEREKERFFPKWRMLETATLHGFVSFIELYA